MKKKYIVTPLYLPVLKAVISSKQMGYNTVLKYESLATNSFLMTEAYLQTLLNLKLLIKKYHLYEIFSF